MRVHTLTQNKHHRSGRGRTHLLQKIPCFSSLELSEITLVEISCPLRDCRLELHRRRTEPTLNQITSNRRKETAHNRCCKTCSRLQQRCTLRVHGMVYGGKHVWNRVPESDVAGPWFFVSVFCTRTFGATTLLSTERPLHTSIPNPILSRCVALNKIRRTM